MSSDLLDLPPTFMRCGPPTLSDTADSGAARRALDRGGGAGGPDESHSGGSRGPDAARGRGARDGSNHTGGAVARTRDIVIAKNATGGGKVGCPSGFLATAGGAARRPRMDTPRASPSRPSERWEGRCRPTTPGSGSRAATTGTSRWTRRRCGFHRHLPAVVHGRLPHVRHAAGEPARSHRRRRDPPSRAAPAGGS